mmetsp:Transcript_3615/g.8679  ORF Transcript_3615/g.8679 Transcript_3615/m.8679 type:complete len:157 (+) Transcript_3615:1030-1500(+)
MAKLAIADDAVSDSIKFLATDQVFMKILNDNGNEIVQLTASTFFEKYGQKFPKCIETFSEYRCKERAYHSFDCWKSRTLKKKKDETASGKASDDALEASNRGEGDATYEPARKKVKTSPSSTRTSSSEATSANSQSVLKNSTNTPSTTTTKKEKTV